MRNMKKTILAIAATIMIATAVQAQDDDSKKRPQGKRPDRTEMVEHRTSMVVKKYGLNDEQAKKLLELNKAYADKMGPRMGGRQGGHRGPGNGQRPGADKKQEKKADGTTEATLKPNDSERKAHREQMEANMKAYDAELQKIMTPEQFKNYKADQEKMRKEGPRKPRQNQQ